MKKNIVIIILSIVILGLGGYLVYDKVIDKEVETKNEEKVINTEDFNFYIAKTLIDNIKELSVYNLFERLSVNGLNDEIKLSMAISKTPPRSNRLCEELFDFDGEYRPNSTSGWYCVSKQEVTTFSYNNVNEQYKNLFGKNLNAPKVGVYSTHVYDYSTKLDAYAALSPAFGPIVSNLYYYDIESVEIMDDNLKIEISYLTYSYSSLDFKDFSYSLNDTIYSNKTEEDIVKAYEDNKNQLPKLTFTYETKDGKYILKSVE